MTAGEPPEAIVEAMTRLRERWHGAAGGRITVGFGPLAPWRCSDETMRRTVALARRWGLPTHLHVAEAQDEIDMLFERTGLRHVEWLHSLDALGPDVHLVHGVWLEDHELDLVAASGSVIVHCPVSNMYLASGIPAVCAMLGRGIPVAMASDGPGSQNSQDMLESLKVAALLAKVSTCDANAVLPLDLLRMATVDGARLFGSRRHRPHRARRPGRPHRGGPEQRPVHARAPPRERAGLQCQRRRRAHRARRGAHLARRRTGHRPGRSGAAGRMPPGGAAICCAGRMFRFE